MCRCDTDAPAGIAKLYVGLVKNCPTPRYKDCKEHHIAENYLTKSMFEHDLCILITHLNSEFQLKMSMYGIDNERNLKITGFFFKSYRAYYSTRTKF